MQPLVPHLWFDDRAEEAVRVYTSVLPGSSIGRIDRYTEANAAMSGHAPGDVMAVSFTLDGQPFVALAGGPHFRFTPAISLAAVLDDADAVDRAWAALVDGGQVLMPLGAYPFAERFGWLVDRFGVSWQLSVGSRAQRVVPCLMFTGEQHGRAAEAMETWTALLGGSITHVDRYGPGEGEREGTVKHATFEVDGRTLTAIDSGYPHGFGFTGAISFLVPCDDQAEVDRLWDALGDGGAPGPCGWLTDRFGVTWQVVPRVLFDLLADPARADRVTRAMLSMQKLDAEALQRA